MSSPAGAASPKAHGRPQANANAAESDAKRGPLERLQRLLRFLKDRLCCKRFGYREVLAKNEWVDMGDRLDRIKTLRLLRNEAFEQQLRRWHGDQHLSRGKIYRKTMLLRLQGLQELCLAALCSASVEMTTGLPRALLERWIFLSLEHDGPHGRVFKARDNQARQGLGLGLDSAKEFAVRVRDRSRGSVLQLPLRQAAKVLSGEVLKRGKLHEFLQPLLACVGLARAKFRNNCFVEQLAVFQTSEFFIEVTEWCEGGSLVARLNQRLTQLDEYTACRIFSRVLMALQYLHDRRLIHRDVRLAQIMLPNKGDFQDPKLGDLWCVARPPKSGVIVDVGMPYDVASTAPEVIRHGHWSAKSDIWSAGCLLFELLHGHPPFGGRGPALVQRVLHGRPEFDETCGKVSAEALDLINLLLRRAPGGRPAASDVLAHPWFEAFGVERPLRRARREPQRVRAVRLAGTPPLSRKGLPAENLLSAKAGNLNGGFCSYMGMTSVDIDFEVHGHRAEEDYWLSAIVVSLWGKGENPRSITLQTATTTGAGAGYIDVLKHSVESVNETQARLEVNLPLRWIRLALRGNFGGIFGIALRKVTFYGYQVRSIEAPAVLSKSAYSRGSSVHVHDDKLPVKAAEEVHESLQKALEQGKRILGTSQRYRVYQDILSGSPHHSSCVSLPALEPIPGVIILAASLGLAYVSVCPPKVPPPRLRVFLVRTSDDAHASKHLLFQTEDLNPPDWEPKDILQKGYASYPPMFLDGFEFFADDPLHVEVQIDNNSGYIHIPADFGLKLYYVPELETPSESDASDTGKQDHGGRHGRRGALTHGNMAAHATKGGRKMLGYKDVDLVSEHTASEDWERDLQQDMTEMLYNQHYGVSGPSDLLFNETDCWHPVQEFEAKAATAAAEKGAGRKTGRPPRPPWWERRGSSATTPSGSESFAESGTGTGTGTGSGSRMGSGGGGGSGEEGWAGKEDGDDDDTWGEEQEKEGAAAQIADMAAEEAERLRREVMEAGAARAALREARRHEQEQQRAQERAGYMGVALPVPGGQICCAPSGQPLDACTKIVRPLASCGFTPSPPPPSPRLSPSAQV